VKEVEPVALLLDPAGLLEILEGNRRLTLRVVQAFPEHELFHYAPAEPLRPFAEMVREILDIEAGYVHGIATGEWTVPTLYGEVRSKEELLAACAAVRQRTREMWPQVTAERLMAVDEDPWVSGPQRNLDRILYTLENEIHHRGQGYTYLRLLGIEPPRFWER